MAFNAHTADNTIKTGDIIVSTELNKNYIFANDPILIITHNEQGTVGILLNHPLSLDAISALESTNCETSTSKYFLGGTSNVKQPLIIKLPAGFQERPFSLRLTNDMVKIAEANNSCDLDDGSLVFLGFEYWQPEQINRETRAGLWLNKTLTNE